MSRVAIIGAQCRFPGGARDPETFFDFLTEGRNVVSDPPDDRWNVDKFVNELDTAGKAYVRRAHYLDYDYTQFDALSFGMAPKEVEFIDPQQRLLLETTWQALEHAGQDIAALAGRPVGVYVGGFTVDHLINQFAGQNRSAIGAHSAAGATLTMLANRISYAFDLRGPSLSIDTACSSSLVAFTQAVQDLEAGRCELAVVGGVNFMLRPEYVIAMCKGRFLARDGRSKSFDAAADGYGRGEGCGVVILKRADAAMADGDRLIALVDGAGVNQDGRTSGITVPNPEAQEALMRQVLDASGVDPATVLYVEAHGTGTPLGDPLEAKAIASVYGTGDRAAPCVIGSVKSNIGHLEAAAGIAGIIKAAWVLDRNMVPPLASLQTPNPALPLADGKIALAAELQPLGNPGATRRVAVNSFGYGGANAHVILSAPPAVEAPVGTPVAASTSLAIVPVSTKSARSLPAAAAALASALGDSEQASADVLYTATRKRAHFEHRAAAWGDDLASARDALARFGDGEPDDQVVSGEALLPTTPRTAFVYTGMGPQWWGMGRGLWASSPVYRAALEEADAVFVEIAGFSILAEMLKDEAASRITRTELAQPANLLVQMGLTRALAAAGVDADAVVGHSVGEVASGWASGMLSLGDALTVSRWRSFVQSQAAGQGAMLAVGIDEGAATVIASTSGGRIDVAAVNGPSAVTLAGESDALAALAIQLEQQGRFAKRLTVEVPYHSAYMDPLKDELIERLAGIRPAAPATPLYSTVTGRRVETERYDGPYWARNVRQTVRFMAAIEALLEDGCTHFVEVGPHPVLSRALLDVIKSHGAEARHVSTLSMQEDDRRTFPRAIAAAHVAGVPIDWHRRQPEGRLVALPTYPFVRERLWRESANQRDDRLAFGTRAMAQNAARGTVGADLAVRSLAFLSDHVVGGAQVVPGAAFLEAFLATAERAVPDAAGWVAADVAIATALVLDADRAQAVEVIHDPSTGSAELRSRRSDAASEPVRHAAATLRPAHGIEPCRVNPAALTAAAPIFEDLGETYARLAGIGLDYGVTFRTVVALQRDAERRTALARLRLNDGLWADAPRFIAHPTLVDGSFQAALALIPPGSGAFLPVAIAELRVLRALPRDLYAKIDLVARSDERLVCDITYFDMDGLECATLRGLACAAMAPRQRGLLLPEADYVDVWQEVAEAPTTSTPAPLWIVADTDDVLASALRAAALAAGREVASLTWANPALAEHLYDTAQGAVPQPCVALLFSAGLDGEERSGERALGRLRAILNGFAPMHQLAPRLVVVTRSAAAATADDRPNPAQAALLGFARVAFGELDEITLDVVDVDAERPDVAALLRALAAPAPEREVALRDGRRLAPVLRPSGLFAAHPTLELRPRTTTPLRLAPEGLVEQPNEPLAVGKIRLAVEALAVPPAAEKSALGVVGRVLDGGQPGRRVVGLVADGDATLATVIDLGAEPARLVDWPEGASAADGAAAALLAPPARALAAALTVPANAPAVVAMTPLGRALADELAGRGCRVTRIAAEPDAWREDDIDAVGTAAVIAAPLAEWSRRLGFGRRLAAGGSLVDLAATPLPFALPTHAGACLRPPSPDRTDARGWAEAMVVAAERATSVPDAMTAKLADWTGDRSAFRIVTVDPDTSVTVRAHLAPTLRADGTYLVTGGFGGLGSEKALWLAENGAGRVAVAGRRGAAAPGGEALLRAIAERGAIAVPVVLDTSDEAAVHSVVAALDTAEAPLRGIYHAAGVLADRRVVEMRDADLATVMRPKVLGALALDQASRGRAVEHFVLFSSIAVSVGNLRQAGYCAANAFLDALAQRRQAEGLPALSVNFGAIASTGMAADPMVEGHLRQIGLAPLPARHALAGVAVALRSGVPQVTAAAALDWSRFVAYDPRGTRTTRLAEVCGPHLERLDGGRADELARELAKAPHNERVGALTVLVGEVIAAELRIDADVINPTRPLEEVGVDSLIAVDIQLAIEAALGVNVPTMMLIGRATLTSVAGAVLVQLGLTADDIAASLAAE